MYYQRFKTPDQRFGEKYVCAPNGCWLWINCRNDEYPKFWHDGRHIKASHYAWVRANGRGLKHGEQVLHRCDTPRCVNPAHLFVGTHAENMRDRERKGRGNHPSGERNGRAVLAQHLVDQIRAEYVPGIISQRALAEKYGVGQTTVSRAVRYENWR